MENHSLTEQIDSLSPELRNEVRDFIEFLLSKHINSNLKQRQFGYGKAQMSADFDAPLEEFKEL